MMIDRRAFLTSLAAAGIAACSRRPGPPFPELEAAGTPFDLGLAHGAAFAPQIRYNLEFYLQWLSQAGQLSSERLLELAAGFAPVLEEHFPQLLEEIAAIARGAGMALEEILLINARTDILAIVEAELASREIPGCTALALQGSVDGRPALALSQNWDWDPLMAEAPVVLRLNPSNGPAVVTLVEAGMVGKIGFNEHRLGVCLNFLSHLADGRPGAFGVPIHCLLRSAMTCASVEEVVATVESAPRCASANFLLAQHDRGGPRALDLEITADDLATLSSGGSSLIHTNHFLDPVLARGCTSGRGPSTMTRFATAQRLLSELEPRVSDPVHRAQRVLESRHELPVPISRDRNPDPSSSTLAGIIMDLTRNRFILTQGPPHRSEWITRPGV
jgi:isopenicillin-N N-acyltransferase-like protein